MMTDAEYNALREPSVRAIQQLQEQFRKDCEPHLRRLLEIESLKPFKFLQVEPLPPQGTGAYCSSCSRMIYDPLSSRF